MANRKDSREQAKIVKRKTPEMQAMVEAGYQMSLKMAHRIVSDWEKNPQTWPLDKVEKAQAMIEAYETEPIPVDPEPGWKRKKRKFNR